jgi:hypothetical protein
VVRNTSPIFRLQPYLSHLLCCSRRPEHILSSPIESFVSIVLIDTIDPNVRRPPPPRIALFQEISRAMISIIIESTRCATVDATSSMDQPAYLCRRNMEKHTHRIMICEHTGITLLSRAHSYPIRMAGYVQALESISPGGRLAFCCEFHPFVSVSM